MESPVKSWCYHCDAYRNADLRFRWAPTGRDKEKKLAVQYIALCPVCKEKMVPDSGMRKIIRLSISVLEKEMTKARRKMVS